MDESFEVVEIYSRGKRLYVKLANKEGKQVSLPKANYVWLKHNPAFKEIPKGYVVHHLDHDPTNDDPTNLVIMQKHQHSAYHWKSKIIEPEISIDEQRLFNPIMEPIIYQDKRHGSFYIYFREETPEGHVYKRRIYSFQGEGLKTKEKAEAVKSFIWDKYQQDKISRYELVTNQINS